MILNKMKTNKQINVRARQAVFSSRTLTSARNRRFPAGLVQRHALKLSQKRMMRRPAQKQEKPVKTHTNKNKNKNERKNTLMRAKSTVKCQR